VDSSVVERLKANRMLILTFGALKVSSEEYQREMVLEWIGIFCGVR